LIHKLSKHLIICIDFDGTIVEHSYPEIGDPLPQAIEVIKEIQQAGHKIILWTCREGNTLQQAVDFCRKHDIEFDGVNEAINDFREEGLKRKPFADYYIDDRNINGFPGWDVVREIVLN